MISVAFSHEPVSAQLWKKVADKAKYAIERDSKSPAQKTTPDTAIVRRKGTVGVVSEGTAAAPVQTASAGDMANYANYDFISGDQIIFQPDLSGEADAEVPSHFMVAAGKAEMQTLQGQKVLHFDPAVGTCILPLMNSLHYLPDQYTIEFDISYEGIQTTRFDAGMDLRVNFHLPEDENYGGYPKWSVRLSGDDKCYLAGQPAQQLPALLKTSLATPGGWHHVAIYVNKSLGKVYVDQYRVAACNTVPQGAGHLSLRGNGKYGLFIKNVRIAQGGDDKYNKIVTEGKFITHGILFDVNKASIRPESMGTLNDIAALMKAHPDLSFEIDGHTDGDGNTDANLRLSQQRADAVKSMLVTMGIEAGRMETKGFGAGKPIDNNNTPEGKANNRRVEFVRQGTHLPALAEPAPSANIPAGRTGAVRGRNDGNGPCCWIGNYNSQAPHETGTINVLRKADGTVWSFRPGEELQQVSGLNDVIAITTGTMHALALKSDGTVWGWGMNNNYQLGITYTTGYVYTPVQIPGVSGAVAITTDKSYTSFALLKDGTVITWNSKGPVKIQGIDHAVAISGANALLADGSVVAWGDGMHGRLGNGSTKSSAVPVKVFGITNAIAISCSDLGGMAELDDGSLWAWGFASTGMLGSGDEPLNGKDPAGKNEYSSVPVRVKGVNHPLSFSANSNTAFALMPDGNILGWGDNRIGGMATKEAEYIRTPRKISGLQDVVAVQSGNFNGYALLKDGTVMGWGSDVVKTGLYHQSYHTVEIAALGNLAPKNCIEKQR